jgi:hypothetical protein
MTLHIRDAAAWEQVIGLHIRDASTWKQVKDAWIRDAGVWKKFYSTMPEFIGSSNVIQQSGGGTLTYHASSQVGDLLIGVVACDDSEQNAGPGDWSFIGRNSNNTEVAVFAKVKGVETSVSWPGSTGGGGPSTVAEVYTFRGVPAGVAGIKNVTGGTSNPADTPNANCLVFMVRGNIVNSNTDGQTSWSSTGNLQNFEEVGDYSYNGGWDVGFAAAYGEMPVAGDPGTITANRNDGQLNFTIDPTP